MTDLPGIVITGASGRMGQMLIRLVAASDRARLAACIVREGHPWVGRDAGEAMGTAPLGVLVTDDPLAAFARAQAVIDFTAPDASVGFAALAAQARAVHVIGTTGLEPHHLHRIALAAHHAHTFWGLCARLYTKLAAHTRCLALNRALGAADFLQLKTRAFPN